MPIVINTPPYGYVDRTIFYRCPVSNEGITSRKQRNETMKRLGMMDANDHVNKKTIAARQDKADKLSAFVEANRGPKHIQEAVDRLAAA